MKDIYYKKRYLRKLSETERTVLSLLLPYWGLSFQQHKGEITAGLNQFSINIEGLNKNTQNQLLMLLKHTELTFSNNARVKLNTTYKKNTSAPITLLAQRKNFYLKPLRKETTNVQRWIHKRLWLPVNENELTLTFHRQEANNEPEWLSYLMIQRFLRQSFEPLDHISFDVYQTLVFDVLKEINPYFAECQLFLKHLSENDWPELPHTNDESNTMSRPLKGNDSTEMFNPFKTVQETSNADPINPFQTKNNKPGKTKINPFKKGK